MMKFYVDTYVASAFGEQPKLADKQHFFEMMTHFEPVSYTHLDVYKRQAHGDADAGKVQHGGVIAAVADGHDLFGRDAERAAPVSYTHLSAWCGPCRRSCRHRR